MKIIAVVVQSVNGRITKDLDSDVYKWTSKEDKKHLKAAIQNASLIIMGSGTYEVAKEHIKLTPQIQRIVLTSRPNEYESDKVLGQLEFYNYSPKEVVSKYSRKGHKQLLLLGGSKVYSDFLENDLINEIWLTVEPLLFGKGKPFIEGKAEASLELISQEKLNDKGTMLMKYRVL